MLTQTKRCEMRPHPASKKTEGGRARLGREVHVVSKYSKIEIDQIDLLVMLQLKVHECSLLELTETKVMSK